MRTPKHSVIMITYNQEQYISIALDSVLCQVPLPYEIIISDDSSTDGTWNIVCEYQKRYPHIIKAKTNKHNLGIFGNLNSVLKNATGDVVSFLSGDDLYRPNLFKSLNEAVIEHNIDLNSPFIIVTNTEHLFLDGRVELYDNYKLRGKNIFKQRVRYGISYRDVGISRQVIDRIDYIRTDLGLHADWIYVLDIESQCEQHYFSDTVSSVYRVGVGSVSKEAQKALYESRIKVIPLIKEKFKNRLDAADLRYLDYESALNSYLLEQNYSNYFRVVRLFFLNLFNFAPNNPVYTFTYLVTLIPPTVYRFLSKLRKHLKRVK